MRSPERPPSALWKALSRARSIWPKKGSLPRYGDRAMVAKLQISEVADESRSNKVQWNTVCACMCALYVCFVMKVLRSGLCYI